METQIYSCSIVLQQVFCLFVFYELLSFTLLVAPSSCPHAFFQVVCLALFCLISEKICVFWVNCTTYLNKFSFLAFVHWKIKFCEVILQEEGIEAEKNEGKTRWCMMVDQGDCRFSEGQVAQNLSRWFLVQILQPQEQKFSCPKSNTDTAVSLSLHRLARPDIHNRLKIEGLFFLSWAPARPSDFSCSLRVKG